MKHKDQPLFDKKGKPRMPGQIGETKVTLIDKQYDWGIYVWKKSNGKWFTDGNGKQEFHSKDWAQLLLMP